MASPILARADALMKRRRQSSVEVDDVPLLTDAISPDDDIPLLLDVVSSAPLAETALVVEPEVTTVAAVEAPAEPAPSLAFEGEMLDIVAHELARRVHERLAAELPAIIESTIREFLAEPEILALIQPRD